MCNPHPLYITHLAAHVYIFPLGEVGSVFLQWPLRREVDLQVLRISFDPTSNLKLEGRLRALPSVPLPLHSGERIRVLRSYQQDLCPIMPCH